MAGSEEHLFRQFRLPWVPTWVPDWLEAVLRTFATWKLLAILVLTVSGSYFGWKFLEARTGQESADLVAWESRLQNANRWELPPLLDSLFQVQNDGAMALGIRQLTSPDPERRQLAGLALRDAEQQWNQWSPDDAGKQRERVVRLLAQVVAGLHAPEQLMAVEIARQSLLQPAATDPTIRDSLLTNSRILFAQAHPAHTAGVRWGENAMGGGSPSDLGEANERPSANRGGVRPVDSNGGTGTTERDSVRDSLANGNNLEGNRFRPAGYSRQQPGDDGLGTRTPPTGERPDNIPRVSQVPLYDGEGRLIEVQMLDPTDTTTPGGLIPVGMSGSPRVPNAGRPGFATPTQIESGYRESSPPTANEFNRIGGSRINGTGSVANAPRDSANSGDTDALVADEETRRRELAAAIQLRAQSISASRQTTPRPAPSAPNRTSQADPGTEVVTSEPRRVTPPTTPLRAEVPTTPVATAPRAIPKNPYRSEDATAPDSMQPLPDAPLEDMIDWRAMSHIEVMFRLRDSIPETARQAVKELERRGFNSEYVAAARRLTNPDPREREQLILDLVASNRIEPIPFLRWLANDPDPGVQSLAINALEMLQASVKDRGAEASSEARRRR